MRPTVQDHLPTEDNRIRSLENWLPLAQAENMRNGWGLNGAELEQLVHDARTALELTVSLLGARTILWQHYRLLREERA